jgi:predicted deacetylase
MKQLLLSIHDVTPLHGPRIARLEAALAQATGRDAAWAMLVVPDFHGRAPIAGDRTFHAWLRARAAAGVEMLLNGWSHRDPAPATWAGRHMTAGEGEFAALAQGEAARRMRDGRRLLEDILGTPVTGFVAPAWLYNDGARAALAQEGFALAEDHWRVWRPTDGATLARGPVITWASRTRARMASSLAFSAVAPALLRPLRVARVACHPHDADHPRLVAELGRVGRTLAQRRRLGRYAELTTRQPPTR